MREAEAEAEVGFLSFLRPRTSTNASQLPHAAVGPVLAESIILDPGSGL